MASISRQIGTVSSLHNVFIPNATVSTGAGLANIVASTVTLAWYRNDQAAVSAWTLTTGTLGTWASSTLSQALSTTALGWYQVSLPDGMFVSGDNAGFMLSGAPSMAPVPVLVELTRLDNQAFLSSAVIGRVGSPVTVSSGVVSVSSATIPFGVSSIATPVAASSLSMPVTVSSGVVGVSSMTIPVGVSSIATPVAASSLSIPVSVSSGSVNVSSATAAVYEGAADALLNRNVSSGANGGRPVKQALFAIRNRVDLTNGIVYQTDDTASSWAFTVSTSPVDPVVAITPA